jgi:hypothetical protein
MVLACPWTGQYSATIQGVTVVMTMNCSGTQLSGRIEAEGYPYTLDLTIDGDSARGTFTDPALGGVLSCRASHMDDHVHLSIGEVEVDQDVVPLRWTFTRMTGNPVPAPPPISEDARDARLIGQWTYSESYTSGTFSFAAQWHLLLAENGALQHTGRTVGGGPDVSANTGNGTTTQGRWRTAENIILVDVGQGFSPMARFVCDGDRLMFTLTDGNKQVWIRE